MTERTRIFLLLLLFLFHSFQSTTITTIIITQHKLAYIHTRTIHPSTHAIIQSLHMIFKKKKQNKLHKKSTSVTIFVKEENKLDYKVHQLTVVNLLTLVLSANILFYFVLTVYSNYKTVYVWKYFIPCGTPQIYFSYKYIRQLSKGHSEGQ